MKQRVECRRCHAHRDLATTPTCLVCGCESFVRTDVTPEEIAERIIDASYAEWGEVNRRRRLVADIAAAIRAERSRAA